MITHYRRWLNEYPFINAYKYSDIKIGRKSTNIWRLLTARHMVSAQLLFLLCVCFLEFIEAAAWTPFNGKLEHFTSFVSCAFSLALSLQPTLHFSPSCPFHHEHCCSGYLFYFTSLPALLQNKLCRKITLQTMSSFTVYCKMSLEGMWYKYVNNAALKAVSMISSFTWVFDYY